MEMNISAPIDKPAKRRKISESCSHCRSKKTRCDGQRPACSPCASKGLTCQYTNDCMVAVSADTLANLETRLLKLESQQRPPVLSNTNPTLGGDSTGEHVHGNESPHECTTTRFIQSLWRASDSKFQSESACPGETLDGRIDESYLLLPERETADDLLQSYERHVYPLFPILHMPTVRSNFELSRNQLPGHRGPFHSLAELIGFYANMNMMFALGCLSGGIAALDTIQERANIFYQRARQLVPLDAVDVPSLETVQLSLLITQYLTHSKRYNRAHSAVGLAIRAAQTLRLDSVAETAVDQRSREMARRVWHGCVTTERLVCSLVGRRVTSFADYNVPLPEAIDDEYLLVDGVGSQPSGKSSITAAWIVTNSLFAIIESARWVVVPSEHVSLSELTTILQLNDRIDQIEDSLPDHLQRSSRTKGPRGEIFELQSDAIMARIQFLRLLLMRPSILAAARQSLPSASNDNVRPRRTIDRLRNEICQLCVQAAIDTIDVLETNLFSPIRIMSSLAIATAFSAATVLVAASLVPELEKRFDLPGVRVSQALNVMSNHRWRVDGSATAKQQLEQFIATIEDVKSQRRGSKEQPSTATLPDEPLTDPISEAAWNFDLEDPFWTLQWSGETIWPDGMGLVMH